MATQAPLHITLARPPSSLVDPPQASGSGEKAWSDVVVDLGPSGERVYRRRETTDQQLGTLVRRVWTEKGGIGAFTARGLNDALQARSAESEPGSASTSAAAAEAEGETATETGEVAGLDTEGMRALKTEVWDQLEQAKHALSNFHHVLTLLLPPTLTAPAPPVAGTTPAVGPVDAHSLPPHVPLAPSSFSTTLVAPPSHPLPASSGHSTSGPSVLLSTKQADIRRTSALLAADARALAEVVEVGRKEWDVALRARREGWGVGLRAGAGRAGASAGGLEGRRDGKDWIVNYGLENAPLALRSKHVVHLPAPSSTPNTAPGPSTTATEAWASSSSCASLVYPSRTRARLSVVVERTQPDGQVERLVSRRYPAQRPEREGAGVDGLDEARREAADEEVFSEVLSEARQSPLMRPSRMAARSVALDVAPGVVLVVELISTAALPPADADASPPDALATLIHSTLSSQLTALHAYRLSALHNSLLPVRDPTRPVVVRPKFLAEAVERLQAVEVERAVRVIVEGLRDAVGQWGGALDVRWAEGSSNSASAEAIKSWRTCTVVLDRSFAVADPDADRPPQQVLTLHLVPPSRMFAVLPLPASTGLSAPAGPRAPVPIGDLAHLQSLLIQVAQACLVRNVVRFVKVLEEEGDDGEGEKAAGKSRKRKTCCFADDGKGVAVLQWTQGQMLARPQLVLPQPSLPSTSASGSSAPTPTLNLNLTVQRPFAPPRSLASTPPPTTPALRTDEELAYMSAGLGKDGSQASAPAGEWVADQWKRVSAQGAA